jgi:hypothetical protein
MDDRLAEAFTARATPHNWKGSVSKLLRGLAAGYGAKKLGGGCLTTILVFILLWWLLGNFELFR